jgi:hypothetical protein
MKNFAALILFTCVSILGLAQHEVLSPATCHPEQVQRYMREREFPPRAQERSLLTLPFFDDFDVYSLATNDPEIPTSQILWEDNYAYINNNYPILPPTLGVATLDGLNAAGWAPDLGDLNAENPSDTLTSLPIDLSSYLPEDNLWLLFHYEAGGRGSLPLEEDSLILEFYTPQFSGSWVKQWAIPGGQANTDYFERVFIPVDSTIFLNNQFQFRFRNYAATNGNFNLWHLDYIFLNEGIDTAAFEYTETSMMYENTSFLRDYTSMPWNHYQSNPSLFMADSFVASERNIQPSSANIVTGYRVGYEGVYQSFPDQDFNTFGNADQPLYRTINLNDFQFDPSVNDTCAVFDVDVFITPINDPRNDTASFKQVFSNYYAYDDGTAERAYGLANSPGGSIAVKFKSEIPDTLYGLLIYFTPYGNDASLDNFLLRAWSNGGGQPGPEIVENFTIYNPHYFEERDAFVYYAYDDPIPVDGIFYAGLTQPGDNSLNIGFDKNTNTNTANTYITLVPGDPWIQSEIEGSLLIRPVLRAARNITQVEELNNTQLHAWPNPMNEELVVQLNDSRALYQVQLFDLTGRVALQTNSTGVNTLRLNTAELAAGGYVLRVTNMASNEVMRSNIMKH